VPPSPRDAGRRGRTVSPRRARDKDRRGAAPARPPSRTTAAPPPAGRASPRRIRGWGAGRARRGWMPSAPHSGARAPRAGAERRQRIAKAGVGSLQVGFDRKRLAIMLDRLLVLVDDGERSTDVAMGLKEVGFEREGSAIGSDRFPMPFQARKCAPQIVICFGG